MLLVYLTAGVFCGGWVDDLVWFGVFGFWLVVCLRLVGLGCVVFAYFVSLLVDWLLLGFLLI